MSSSHAPLKYLIASEFASQRVVLDAASLRSSGESPFTCKHRFAYCSFHTLPMHPIQGGKCDTRPYLHVWCCRGQWHHPARNPSGGEVSIKPYVVDKMSALRRFAKIRQVEARQGARCNQNALAAGCHARAVGRRELPALGHVVSAARGNQNSKKW